MGEEKKKGLFARLREGLSKTRGNMTEKVDDMVRENRKIDEDFYEELEDILLMADCGLKATTAIIDELRDRVKNGKVKDAAQAREMLKEIMIEQMNIPRPPLKWPMVMLIVGVNGVGKTTTIGKLALRFQAIGRKVMLCAGDTFRAAAAEQLTVWAERARVPIVKHAEGADPAAVVFDAIKSAKAQQADLLIVDTAGRLHNKKNLMDELNKMRRVIDREYPEADTRCILVLDATTGQNGLTERPRAASRWRSGRSWRCRYGTSAWAKGSTICSPLTRKTLWKRCSDTKSLDKSRAGTDNRPVNEPEKVEEIAWLN